MPDQELADCGPIDDTHLASILRLTRSTPHLAIRRTLGVDAVGTAHYNVPPWVPVSKQDSTRLI
ncbi:MAG: hypothetical protein HQL87_16600 [Magnetococcales bacterium]|nr:hypothetical protein [Magnetococcales bacterium]